ncbi:ATP phosphoribosyltransferase regulatory subunit [compost metagenome]
MTFEGYAADLGFPVVSGGRYDNLLAQFGRPAPATGFALKTTRVLELLGDADDTAAERTLVVYDAEGRAEALEKAQELRAAGASVVTERVQELSGAVAEAAAGAQAHFTHKGVHYTACISFMKGGKSI